MIASACDDGQDEEMEESSRTELDSHANMVVVGKHCLVVEWTGRTAIVNPFTPDYEALTEVPIVDAAIMYECPFSGKNYILLVRNALHVPAMNNNLVPPFIMREAGIKVRDTPKIQIAEPTVEDHTISFQDFRIPLSLWGIFSYFPTSAPTNKEIEECDDVYLITPNGVWNPHSEAYSANEEGMLDWEGNMVERQHRKKILLSDIDDDKAMASAATISKVESRAIDQAIQEQAFTSSVAGRSEASIIYDQDRLCELLSERAHDSHFMMSVGSTNAWPLPHLIPDDENSESTEGEHDESFDALQELEELDEPFQVDVDLDDFMDVSATHARVKRNVQAEHLSKIWRIDLETASKTLDITSQNCARTKSTNLTRNYATNDKMLRYKRIKEFFFMDTFFATSKAGKSSRGNSCCQLFVTDKGFIYVVPMKKESDVMKAVKQFAKEIGAPEAIICDAARAQISQDMKKFCNEIGTTLRALEEGTPWANKAELYIGLIKEAVRKDMKSANSPISFWDYCIERRARINNLTARDLFQLHGTNPHTAMTSDEGDISNLCQYDWYQWCYYREHTARFPFNREVLGRVLGPAKGEGNDMAQWILKANGNVVPRRTLRPLNTAELHSSTEVKKRQIYDALIERRWGTSMSAPPKVDEDSEEDTFEEYYDSDEQPRIIPDVEDTVDSNGRLLEQQPMYDRIINAEVQLQNGDEISLGKVKRRALGPDGLTTGSYADNPMLNSIVYEVEFPDGQTKEYAANTIAENMLSQVDSDGYSTTLIQGIVDFRKDESTAIPKSNKWVTTARGQRRLRKSTVGWKLLVQWRDGSETWIPLKDMKESHPVETAEFAKARGIDDEVAFAYWVPYTLRKRDVIISKMQARCNKRKITHKYGIEVPTSIEHGCKLDEQNGDTCWRDALSKEMKNVGIAFQVLEEGENEPVGWSKVTGHLVFDVKMDFTRKARWVLDGHKTPDPIGSTYAGVVSRESVRIALTYAALNGLDVTAADIRNAYLQAPSSQKDYIICGPEFGLENVGKKALITRALYGGKAAGKDFRNHLRSCMRHLDFTSCLADPDVWMRQALKPDGSEYWEYVLIYTDDVLVISTNGEKLLREGIGKYFELKEESIGPPKIYLGGSMRQVELENGVKAWAFSSSQYVQEAVRNVESYLDQKGGKLPTRAETPMQTSYRPELDVTPELNAVDAAYFQSVIGILRWIVELGRIDICLEVSMLSSHLALPREGHLAQTFHVFAYLKKYHNTEMVFDPSDPVIDEASFDKKDWTSSEFGHVAGTEELPPNMPQPRGFGFVLRAKVDADHAADTVTRRSRTGFLVFLNSAPVYWLSKKQTSVESSTFGSEFCAMKHCCEYLRGLRYKLRMMGIPCEQPAYIQGDNQSVLYNTTIPDSTLKKKAQSIAYHFVREGSARDEWRTSYVSTHDNESDLLTKPLPSGEKRRGFVRNLLHHIFCPHAAVA
jgi:hypothetical protein